MSNFKKQGVTYGDQGLPTYGVICNRDLKFVNSRINQQYEPTISVKDIINPRLSCGKYYKNNFGSNAIWYPNMFIDLNYNSDNGGYINANGPNGPYFALGLGNYPRSMYKQLYFGSQKRYRSPEKQSYETYYIFESEDENEQIQDILNDPYTKKGDYISYMSNNQMGAKTARIMKDRDGNKKLGPWKYLYEDFFGKYKKSSKKLSPKKRKIPTKYCLPKQKKYPVDSKKRCSAALSYARYAPEPCIIATCVEKNCKKYPNVGAYSRLIKECKEKRKRKSKKI